MNMPFRLLAAAVLLTALIAPGPAYADEIMELGELLSEAEANNPSLMAMKDRYEAARERVPQAGTWDDPMLTLGFMNVEVDNFAFDRIPMTAKVVGLSQKIPFFGKTALREESATRESRAQEAEYRDRLLMVRAEVKKAYYELYYIERALDTVDKNFELAKVFEEVAKAKYSFGDGTFRDIVKAQVEQSRLVEKRLMFKKEESSIRARLGALAGREEPVQGTVRDISPADVPLDREALTGLARSHRPALAAFSERISGAQAEVDLASKRYYPDFTVSLTYGQTETLVTGMEQSDRLSALVTVNLPVFWGTKIRPGIREAAFKRSMYQGGLETLTDEISYRVDSLLAAIEQSGRTASLFGDVALPQATEDLDSALSGYEVGRVDFLTLIDSERTLFEYELGYHRALAEREKSVAELEAVVGREF